MPPPSAPAPPKREKLSNKINVAGTAKVPAASCKVTFSALQLSRLRLRARRRSNCRNDTEFLRAASVPLYSGTTTGWRWR